MAGTEEKKTKTKTDLTEDLATFFQAAAAAGAFGTKAKEAAKKKKRDN